MVAGRRDDPAAGNGGGAMVPISSTASDRVSRIRAFFGKLTAVRLLHRVQARPFHEGRIAMTESLATLNPLTLTPRINQMFPKDGSRAVPGGTGCGALATRPAAPPVGDEPARGVRRR